MLLFVYGCCAKAVAAEMKAKMKARARKPVKRRISSSKLLFDVAGPMIAFMGLERKSIEHRGESKLRTSDALMIPRSCLLLKASYQRRGRKGFGITDLRFQISNSVFVSS